MPGHGDSASRWSVATKLVSIFNYLYPTWTEPTEGVSVLRFRATVFPSLHVGRGKLSRIVIAAGELDNYDRPYRKGNRSMGIRYANAFTLLCYNLVI